MDIVTTENTDIYFFMTSLDEVVSYDTCKESFIGMYNSLKNPKSLNEKYLSNKSGKNFHMVSCIQIYLNLNPCDKKKHLFIWEYANRKLNLENYLLNINLLMI